MTTSKEALNSIADKCAIKEYDKDGNLIKWVGTIDKEYLTIMQDLEVLEAIKNKAQNNSFFRGCLLRMFVDIEYDGKYFRTKKKVKDEDYEKIVRWLDNE